MAERLTAFLARWRWWVTAIWVFGLCAAAVLSAPLPQRLSGGGWSVEGSDSAAVASQLQHGFQGRGASDVTVVVHDRWYAASEPGFDKRVRRVLDEVRSEATLEVASRVGYSTSAASGPVHDSYVGKDDRTAVDVLGLDLEDGTARRILPEVQSDLTHRYAAQGLDVSLVGTASYWGEVNRLSEEGLAHAELLTLPLILLVLVLMFGGVVAALTALSVGVTAILFSFAVLAVLSGQHELSLFVQNTATMLGLGVGVDYSLFMIARFKEELTNGRTVDEAVAASLRTSGETVLFSGVTIIAAMSTLFLVPLGVITSIALGAVIVVAFSILAALVLLPVLLRLLGHRIYAGRVRVPGWLRSRGSHRQLSSARWQRLAARVMRQPVAYLAVGVFALLVLAAPARSLTTFTPDISIVPTSSPVRQGFDRMQEQFGVGSTAPIRVVVEAEDPLATPTTSTAVTSLAQRISDLPSVDRVDSALPVLSAASPGSPLAATAPGPRAQLPPDVRAVVDHFVSADGHRTVLEVVPRGRAATSSTQALLRDVQEASSDAATGLTVRVGGETAEGVTSNALIQDRLPLVIAVMLAVIYLLLLITFRSLLLPLKAIAMNLLSVGATFGVLVVVFQHGVGAGLLGVDGPGDVQNFVPVLLITLLFSLSTDYEVFLLNRVREEYAATGDNTGSVARAMASTAPLISGAALLMVVVFGSFALAGILPIKQLGFAMAIAIAIDASIVRLLLVPAAMRLMGSWNWWMPTRRPRVVADSEGGRSARSEVSAPVSSARRRAPSRRATQAPAR